MTIEKPFAAQVKILLSALPDQCGRHLSEAETDLEQMRFLLQEASAKLCASFLAVHEVAGVQQEIVNALACGQALAREDKEKLKEQSDEIGRQLNAAVTGLQFQDLTNQLINRASGRIAGMRGMLEQLRAGAVEMAPDDESTGSTALLARINGMLAAQSRELDGLLWKAVRQVHMESGDIELF